MGKLDWINADRTLFTLVVSAVFLQDNLFDMLQTQQAELETRLMDENIDIVSVHIIILFSFSFVIYTIDTRCRPRI